MLYFCTEKRREGYNRDVGYYRIYLRARYYDPSVARFVQIDQNYDGTKEHIASQNKYVYTLNNPYKYVDRNGNWSLFKAIGDVVNNVVKTVKKVVKKAVKTVASAIKFITTPINQLPPINSSPNGPSNGNNSTNKGGGSSKSKVPSLKKVNAVAKCPTIEPKVSLLDILLNCVNWVPVIENVRDVLDGGTMKFNGTDAILRNLRPSKIKNVQITISGAKDYVKKFTTLSTSSKQYLVGALKKDLMNQIKVFKTSKFSIFMFILILESILPRPLWTVYLE